MIYADTIVNLALSQAGGKYLYGGKAGSSVVSPKASGLGLDCSGLVTWAVDRAGGSIPNGTTAQIAWCKQHGTTITNTRAAATLGALSFLSVSDQHVVISLGDGRTIEARGAAYGIGEWSDSRDTWDYSALIPGVYYGAAPSIPPVHTTFGRLLYLASPYISGSDVRAVQGKLVADGYKIAVDGVYGPLTAATVGAFQTAHHLAVDRVVGPITWTTLGL